MNLIRIYDKNPITNLDEAKIFMNPDYVYIPIIEGYQILVNNNDIIKCGQPVLKNGKKNIYSSVSGKVIGKTTDITKNNKPVESIVIENDFMETVSKRNGVLRYINEYKREDAVKLLEKYNVINEDLNKQYDSLIINGLDLEPFEYTNSLIINEYNDKLLEAIDAMARIFEIDNVVFTINENDNKNVINLNNNIGTYPNIRLKLIENLYPLGNKMILIKELLNQKDISDNYLYLTVNDVLNIYNVLKRKQPITTKIITLSGDLLKEKMIINVKIGTTFKDIICNVNEIDKKDYNVVVNGLISGYTVKSLNEIVDDNVKSVFINTNLKDKESSCINCGLCNLKCPVGLNPKYLSEHKKADRSKCIDCGLCTYLCPSKINFKKYLGGKNNE